jgi:methylmalonyl-CoA mutase N-terminal domain/subunit
MFVKPGDVPGGAGVARESPGEFPYTRGIQPTMYRGRLWTMRQYAGFGTAAESNARYRYLLAQGVSGLSVAFDLPTQMGYDSDHAMAAGESGAWASRSIRSRTWPRCSTASRWVRSRRR